MKQPIASYAPSVLLLALVCSCGSNIMDEEEGITSEYDEASQAINFARGEWPSGSWRPFSDTSPFNRRLPPSPPIHPNSANIVQRIFDIARYDYPDEFAADLSGGGGEPTYYSQVGDPEFTVHCTMYGCSSMEGQKLRIPAGARAEDPTDQHLTVVDQATGYEYDFWVVEQARIPSTGGILNVASGGRSPISGSGIMVRGEGSATAASFASLAGRIRAEELEAGQINHALFIGVNCTNQQVVYPATNGHYGQACSDIGQPNTDAPAMGQHLRLNYTEAEIDALNAPAWRKTIYKAMANYGMFIGDTGTAGLFNFERESDYMYTSLGYRPKWLDFARANGWFYYDGGGEYPPTYIGDFGNKSNPDGLDWRRLQVIDPCVSEGTCGGTTPPTTEPTTPSTQDLALRKPAWASSTEASTLGASNANDGSNSTRWASAYADSQWLRIDLGSNKSIQKVTLNWETAYCSKYKLQTRREGSSAYSTVISPTISREGTVSHTFAARSARYVRVLCSTRATSWGMSLWSVEVY